MRPTANGRAHKLRTMEWFNFYGLITVLLILIPNILCAVFDKTAFENARQSKCIMILEQVGRFGCIAFMIFNVPFTCLGFWFESALAVYLIVSGALLAVYAVGWVVFWKKRHMLKMVWLSVTPTALFLFCGAMVVSAPLLVSAVLFGIGHITISCGSAL